MPEPISTPETTIPETPQVGMVARFIAVFTDPRKAFSSVRKNHEWVVVLILVIILGAISFQLTKPYIIQEQLSRIEERLDANPNITAEQREEILENTSQMIGGPVGQVIGLVFVLIMLFAGAGILLFLGNIIMGGQTSYLHVLNVFALSWLVSIPESIIKVPLAISKETARVHTSLALLLPSDQATTFLGTLLGKFDVFGLWQLILVIIGLSVLCRTSVAKSAWTVGIAWFIWVLIQSGLAAIGMQFGG